MSDFVWLYQYDGMCGRDVWTFGYPDIVRYALRHPLHLKAWEWGTPVRGMGDFITRATAALLLM